MNWADRIVEFTPEPCHGCATGFVYIMCAGHDGRPRCRPCVHKLAVTLGYLPSKLLMGEPAATVPVVPDVQNSLFDE